MRGKARRAASGSVLESTCVLKKGLPGSPRGSYSLAETVWDATWVVSSDGCAGRSQPRGM